MTPGVNPKHGDFPFRSAHTPGFPSLLESLGISLLVTTYQAGKLMAIRSRQGRISTLLRSFDRPMGLTVREGSHFALGSHFQIWHFRNAPELARQIPPQGEHDACFLPRHSLVTGDIRGHEIAWAGHELWVVNTLFSCLCTLDAEYSFVPRWHPRFLPGPMPGDHCHLNGIAVENGNVRFVTALGESTEAQGWRTRKADGGIVLDVASQEIICRGLSMPHSPRLRESALWLLESGTGQLKTVEANTGKSILVTQLPGFPRGLAFHGPYAFIGLSKVREKNLFGNLPLTSMGTELSCGIWVVDLRTGQIVQFMEFQAGVEEIFAVEILAGFRFPEIVGLEQTTIQGAFALPPAKPIS